MKDGTYQYALELKAPIGSRFGRLALELCRGIVSGTLTLFGQTLPIDAGSCSGDTIRFTGQMQTLRYLLPYRAEGEISQSLLQLSFHTAQGCFLAVGKAPIPTEGAKKRA